LATRRKMANVWSRKFELFLIAFFTLYLLGYIQFAFEPIHPAQGFVLEC
jgi:hypothetical protein